MSETLNDELRQATENQLRIIELLKRRRESLQEERDGMYGLYNEEISAIGSKLMTISASLVADDPNWIGGKAYEFLRGHPGRKFRPGHIMSQINANGAVASVVLADFIRTGLVKCSGKRGGSVYWTEVGLNETSGGLPNHRETRPPDEQGY